MALSRELQNQILTELAEAYPLSCEPTCLETVEPKIKAANLFYLMQHNLIEEAVQVSQDNRFSFHDTTITHSGLDFLADDGGLSAILGAVTIRFADSELRALLKLNLAQSSETPEDKKRLIDQLQELPSESIKHLTLKLLDLGLENGQQAIEIIKAFFQ